MTAYSKKLPPPPPNRIDVDGLFSFKAPCKLFPNYGCYTSRGKPCDQEKECREWHQWTNRTPTAS